MGTRLKDFDFILSKEFILMDIHFSILLVWSGIWKGENNKTVSNIFKLVNCSKPKRSINPKFWDKVEV